jgi:hypothetical protein
VWIISGATDQDVDPPRDDAQKQKRRRCELTAFDFKSFTFCYSTATSLAFKASSFEGSASLDHKCK